MAGEKVEWHRAINTTPHEIVLMHDGVPHHFPKDNDMQLRLNEEDMGGLTDVCGIPVVAAPRYTGLSGPVPDDDRPILVSQLVGQYIATHGLRSGHVYGPDTGPGGVVRDADGKIIGTRRFVRYV